MALHDYRFRSEWSLDVPARAVFDAVVDLMSYPAWWPDVRSVREVDPETAELVCRSVLPFALVVRMRREVQDEAAGTLRVAISGDLRGSLGATIAEHDGPGVRLRIDQDVEVTKSALRLLTPLCRPLFRANHAAMMRRGRRGLQRYLAEV